MAYLGRPMTNHSILSPYKLNTFLDSQFEPNAILDGMVGEIPYDPPCKRSCQACEIMAPCLPFYSLSPNCYPYFIPLIMWFKFVGRLLPSNSSGTSCLKTVLKSVIFHFIKRNALHLNTICALLKYHIQSNLVII